MRRWTKLWLSVAISLTLLCGGVIVFGLAQAAQQPVVRKTTVLISGWPQSAPTVRLALISDIHLGNRAMSPARLRTIVKQVNDERPDIVLIAGDFIIGHGAEGAKARAFMLTEPLARLRAPLGVIAVLGNHDYWTVPDAIREALHKAGIAVLENTAVRRGPLAIIGISDAFSGHDDLAHTMLGVSRIGGFPVVLTHTPDLNRKLPRGGLPLLLAGHTHCGQVVLPWIGPVMTRSPVADWKRLYDPRYKCGVVRDGGRTLIVSGGLGSGSSPIRIGAPPDMWLVELRGSLRQLSDERAISHSDRR